ncbi:hypothetical protein JI721_05915 [Alicyclobacillus cycloheptanicus]|uniref:DUF3600 domain-containing protein n=1 Tax=Alicyclobacillus cycloheptanicus TaxID=1457 RepID=A0ABT9XMQ0_9BACL|nr:hypothetical protein [Alicyclobacillus cycloheptanicus]MDQ0191563.1 hypothetical protein [Alicyclobacillus cycloheptanicus]WDM02343.1 hypothetical protein JI721_05915 [Alicyclobacillus cycloheptanicus]
MKSLNVELSDTLHSVLDSKTSSVSFEVVWEKYGKQETTPHKVTKKMIFCIIISVVIISGGGLAAASSLLSSYTQNLRSAAHANGIFEYINGTPVSNQEFDSFKAGQELVSELNHQSINENQIIQMFNRNQVLYQQAQKDGLIVSDQQAKNFALKVQQTLEHPSKTVSQSNASQIIQILKAEEKGLGVSDQEYWTHIAPTFYKVDLSIGKLKQEFYTQYQTEHPGATYLQINNAWNRYGKMLLEKASIRIS